MDHGYLSTWLNDRHILIYFSTCPIVYLLFVVLSCFLIYQLIRSYKHVVHFNCKMLTILIVSEQTVPSPTTVTVTRTALPSSTTSTTTGSGSTTWPATTASPSSARPRPTSAPSRNNISIKLVQSPVASPLREPTA